MLSSQSSGNSSQEITNKNIEESLIFNIIYIPGMTKYLKPFVSSLLNSTKCRYRLVSNGCVREEQRLLEAYCSENPRLEYFLLSSDNIVTHCKALTILQEMEDSDYFCFMDADIFSSGPFLEEFLPYLKQYSGVFSAYPIWCDAKYQLIPNDWPDMGGRHIISSDGVCLGGSYFAMYDNRVLKGFIKSTGINFSRYSWQEIPAQYQEKLLELGLNKNTYDTAKVLNILLQDQGHSLLFIESESLFHLGAMTEFFSGKIDRLFKGKLPHMLSLQKKQFRKMARGLKHQLQKIFGNGPSDLTEQANYEYRQMLKTRETVSGYFLELLMAVSGNRPFNKKLEISNPEIERRVALATKGIKSIWKESGYHPK